jgi:hypothetical protein
MVVAGLMLVLILGGHRIAAAAGVCDRSGGPGTVITGHAIIFTHAEFRGLHRHIINCEENLNRSDDWQLNDEVSSIIILSGSWRFFVASNFEVPMMSPGGFVGPGAFPSLEKAGPGFKNDKMSSLCEINFCQGK